MKQRKIASSSVVGIPSNVRMVSLSEALLVLSLGSVKGAMCFLNNNRVKIHIRARNRAIDEKLADVCMKINAPVLSSMKPGDILTMVNPIYGLNDPESVGEELSKTGFLKIYTMYKHTNGFVLIEDPHYHPPMC